MLCDFPLRCTCPIGPQHAMPPLPCDLPHRYIFGDDVSPNRHGQPEAARNCALVLGPSLNLAPVHEGTQLFGGHAVEIASTTTLNLLNPEAQLVGLA